MSRLMDRHLDAHVEALDAFQSTAALLDDWGNRLARRLTGGGRLLAAGNGGSAAQAQHLVGELVGKLHEDRPPLSGIALSAEPSGLTAIGNDYGWDEVFARQVRAHARPGDLLLLLSTSGASRNILAAARAGARIGIPVWGLTGALPNALAEECDEVLAVPSGNTQVVQELHLVAIHLLCAHLDAALPYLDLAEPVAAQVRA